METLPTDPQSLLARLQRDGATQLWVTYHDYNGRPAAKMVPVRGFPGAASDGVVFAMANMDFDSLDHQAVGATLLADSGDFLAVPDPRSYALLPRYPKTARVYAWMRKPDGSPWEGCPRTRLQSVVDALRDAGLSVQAALEPEFYLLRRDDDGHYHPVNRTRMFSETGLSAEHAFVDASRMI